MKERRARVEDALRTPARGDEGILPGGGVALLRAWGAGHAARRQPRRGLRHPDRAARGGEPLRQLVANGDLEPSVVLVRVVAGSGAFGFNAATEEYGDLMAMGVLDPCRSRAVRCRTPLRWRV